MDFNVNAKWSGSDDRRLQMSDTGKSHRAMADTLGRTASGIEQRLYILRNRQPQNDGRQDAITHEIQDGRMMVKPAK